MCTSVLFGGGGWGGRLFEVGAWMLNQINTVSSDKFSLISIAESKTRALTCAGLNSQPEYLGGQVFRPHRSLIFFFRL